MNAFVTNATKACMHLRDECEEVMNLVQCGLLRTISIHDSAQWLELLLHFI